MPEGPECRRLAVKLNGWASDRKITKFLIHSGRYLLGTKPTGYDNFMDSLPLKVEMVRTHGKFIYWVLDKDIVIFNTLGMSGGWTKELGDKHARVLVQFDEDKMLHFCDQRNFGTFKFATHAELQIKLATLGPDPLAGPYTKEMFRSTINSDSRKKRTIAQTLMDQKMIAGIGNYLKSEILWLCRISPHRETGSLSSDELELLCSAINSVPRESFFAQKGSSILTYRGMNKDKDLTYPGGETLAVYRKKFDPIGNEVVNEKTADKRTSWWVPGYQI